MYKSDAVMSIGFSLYMIFWEVLYFTKTPDLN